MSGIWGKTRSTSSMSSTHSPILTARMPSNPALIEEIAKSTGNDKGLRFAPTRDRMNPAGSSRGDTKDSDTSQHRETIVLLEHSRDTSAPLCPIRFDWKTPYLNASNFAFLCTS
ncbi:hypothetical protein D9756_002485 [Leucocoprinus leucothites]|uniref:Uncharacterized protein n=1 Tax=Leucocoprinus leucothites TaxID=201217 RepID=A0A8H5GC04_9AGAR|nr:hypothetical protein D9756_002485 [Leucoagaricus leucothites]